MNKARIENLADGVFGIILTLLVLDLKIPSDAKNHVELMASLIENGRVFFAYILIFATLTTYWLSHNYLVTICAKKVDRALATTNILFLFCLSLLPFSANLLGQYSMDPIAILVYGLNVMAIIGSLFLMRYEIFRHPENEAHNIPELDLRYGKIRLWFSLILTLIGIMIAPIDTTISIVFYIIPLVFGIIPGGIAWIDRWILRNKKI